MTLLGTALHVLLTCVQPPPSEGRGQLQATPLLCSSESYGNPARVSMPSNMNVTSLDACRVPEGTQANAKFVAKADGVLAGLAVVDQACN